MRDQVQKAADELKKRAASRKHGNAPLKISVGRLRGRHGASLLGGILRKIESADVLFFDISGNNPNVLFELGYALAIKGADSGRVYVFCDESKTPCSDLKGFMLTYYQSVKSELKKTKNNSPVLKLEDPRGFLAALRGTLIQIATDRDMWGESKILIDSD